MAAGYDTLETIVNATRVRINDALVALTGEILTDTQPFTIQVINNAWRRMQEKLSKLGFQKFTGQTILTSLAAVSGTDQATLARLDWAGWYNGAVNDAAKVLPADFIAPMKDGLEERITGSNKNFMPMDDLSESGMPLRAKSKWLKCYEWRGDAIWFVGSTSIIDLRLRYWAYASDFVPPGTMAFTAQTVPIMRCLDAFSNYIAAEYSAARGDIDAQQFVASAEAACLALVGRENPDGAALAALGGE